MTDSLKEAADKFETRWLIKKLAQNGANRLIRLSRFITISRLKIWLRTSERGIYEFIFNYVWCAAKARIATRPTI
ncbi:hypothetical protein ATY37_13900 [Vibrio cidicii]|uniref:Uncharacterized protein n=1 Tax=Vibrio cidicii TaxID=1763883 RepID=A0A151JHX0_9VIBR|nr:hypothetical protein AUQ44_07240 [Vibrio cidicii]KYN89020.1 hypothetical protein ATY37_13900 [Vibrio cidicii]